MIPLHASSKTNVNFKQTPAKGHERKAAVLLKGFLYLAQPFSKRSSYFSHLEWPEKISHQTFGLPLKTRSSSGEVRISWHPFFCSLF